MRLRFVEFFLLAGVGGCANVAPAPTETPAGRETSAKPVAADDPIKRVDILRGPNGDEMAKAYPEAAQEKRIEGSADMACIIEATGGLRDCRILQESPQHQGFGAAALEVAPVFRIGPLTKYGVPTSGRAFQVRLRWVLKH